MMKTPPILFMIFNRPSTTAQSFAIAAAGAMAGFDMRLVAGPVALRTPKGVKRIDVVSARKCREKRLAFIVANDVTQAGAGFGTDTNRVTLVFPDGRTHPTCGRRRSRHSPCGSAIPSAYGLGSRKLGGYDLHRTHVEVWPLMSKRRVAARIIRTLPKIVQ